MEKVFLTAAAPSRGGFFTPGGFMSEPVSGSVGGFKEGRAGSGLTYNNTNHPTINFFVSR